MNKLVLVGVVLLLLSVNPITEELEFRVALVYMLSHYSLVSSGFLIGFALLRSSWYNLIVGAVPIAFWHLPFPFALGASFLLFRVMTDVSLFLGGLLVGSTIHSVPQWVKITLLSLYMLGDTVLSVIFIIADPLYSQKDFHFLLYPPSSLPIVGVAMILVMNVVVAIVVYLSFKSILRWESED
ncbi:DUF1404 domain-containing protein [Metallosphaera tengchongensis]|uniref:DUF1404 domain-containing protein n=1 Tax=Metallosphaera tengchongensis TaxID=1532350 RepID=A0A6N0NYV8_9CREN|nr:DUF1404 domain-containing protein [Metallosphaera tengchongensis]QKR00270.1 DUF1404 domain-containing protein [Metallosphaera tengchongensis]